MINYTFLALGTSHNFHTFYNFDASNDLNCTAIILYIFLTIILLREIQEMMVSGPWSYFTSTENLLQDLIIVLTVSFIAVAPINTEVGTHLAAWAVFWAWVSFPKFCRNILLYKK